MDCFKTTKTTTNEIQHTKSETVIVGGTILDKVVTQALSYVPEEDLSLEMLLFKYLQKHKSVGVLNVCLNLIRMKRMTNIALTLWLTPMGTISSTVLEFYSSGRSGNLS